MRRIEGVNVRRRRVCVLEVFRQKKENNAKLNEKITFQFLIQCINN